VLGVVLAVAGCGLSVKVSSTDVASGTPELGGDGGYHSFPLGRDPQLVVGRPWGSPCQPVVVYLAGSPDALIQKQAIRVVDEARALGLDVWFMKLPPGAKPGSYGQFTVTAEAGRAPVNPGTGRPVRYSVHEKYLRMTDTGEHRLFDPSADVFSESLGGDRALTRKAFRAVIAAAVGLSTGATTERTGLAEHLEDSADAFSDADATALRKMSGCEAPEG
jgi:hypothetical protein